MRVYNREEAIFRINSLSKAGRACIFIINYDQTMSYVEELSDINDNECKFYFNGNTNMVKTFCGDKHKEEPEWNIFPESTTDYKRSFDIVQSNIKEGNSYLANLTCRIPIKTNIGLETIFNHSEAPYKLWIKDKLVCFSPETFVKINNRKISSFPMKGTIDATIVNAAEVLMKNEKEAAEHATIVDLIRNDISIVATDVKVDRYRYIENINTNKGAILQTSSEISGILPDHYTDNIGDVIFSMLPAGSITGAPKKKTVDIISEAENYNRGFYTGIMGIYQNGCIDSAVMIRFIDQENGQMYFKAGGGITAKSKWIDEYNEIIQKVYVPIF